MRFKIDIFLAVLLSFSLLQAHGYVFSKANDEMRDNIRIDVSPGSMTIMYQSLYLGQIAPHIRLMIDTNGDEQLTDAEIDTFFAGYKRSLNQLLLRMPIELDGKSAQVRLVDVFATTLQTDSLLAPFQIQMLFMVEKVQIGQGEHELVIDPRVLFENGSFFIDLARERVEFTESQVEAIGRFLQVSVYGSEKMKFISTYPGRLKKGDKMVFIYGVFYDDTVLGIDSSQAYKFRIKFTAS
jgi:hypothetical protein